jgi:hypothetical protein
MESELSSAFQNYLELVRQRVGVARSGIARWNALDETTDTIVRLPLPLLSEDQLLAQLADDLERTMEFRSCVSAIEREFPDRNVGGLPLHEECLKTYLRLSGLYQRLFESEISVDEETALVRATFAAPEQTTTFLVPLEFVDFPREVDCDDAALVRRPARPAEARAVFRIRHFTAEELDALLTNRPKRVFYRWAAVDSTTLAKCWFLVAGPHSKEEEGMMVGSPYKVCFSDYPRPIQWAWQLLALYDWDSFDPVRQREADAMLSSPDKVSCAEGPLHFKAPFVLRSFMLPVEWPEPAPAWQPDAWIHPSTGEESCEPNPFYLSEKKTDSFERFLREAGIRLKHIRRCEGLWSSLEIALGFLLKGFVTDTIEQLLWNITAIEAALGEKVDGGLTKLLRSRVSRILGNTPAEQKSIARAFDKLYEFRSDMIHGNASLVKKNVWDGHLRLARELARRVVLWMVRFAGHAVASAPTPETVPKREDLLSLIDLDSGARAYIANLPPGFPNLAEWIAVE